MKIYVASHCRWAGLYIAGYLQNEGHTIVSSWLTKPFKRSEEITLVDKQDIANTDTADVRNADTLVLIAGPDKYPGGKFVEAGIAIGLNIPIIVLGKLENVLLYGHNIARVDEPREIVNLLTAAPTKTTNTRS